MEKVWPTAEIAANWSVPMTDQTSDAGALKFVSTARTDAGRLGHDPSLSYLLILGFVELSFAHFFAARVSTFKTSLLQRVHLLTAWYLGNSVRPGPRVIQDSLPIRA
jgi:hypothetical protein